MPVAVRELELDLDAFEGPFDLLLSLVLREDLPLRELDLAQIVVAFVEHLAEREALDLDACGEFLILISALLELKARAMFPEEDVELVERKPAPQDPGQLREALRLLAVEPAAPSTAHMALRFPPVAQFLERWRSLLARRSRLDFDQEVAGFSRVEVAVAFLALLELRKAGEVAVSQAAPFAP